MKGKDLTVFIRYGGLDLKNQKGYVANPNPDEGLGYHSPPASRGFYAMPKVAQEMFLVGCIGETQPSMLPKKNYDKRNDWTEEQWNEWGKKYNKAFDLRRKVFRKDEGNIWHHLTEEVENHEVIDRHGSWVKTSIAVWKKAFMKNSLKSRYGESKDCLDLSIRNINEPPRSGLFGMYSKDHCEVFIDEKV